jgi:hypothetical protein
MESVNIECRQEKDLLTCSQNQYGRNYDICSQNRLEPLICGIIYTQGTTKLYLELNVQ